MIKTIAVVLVVALVSSAQGQVNETNTDAVSDTSVCHTTPECNYYEECYLSVDRDTSVGKCGFARWLLITLIVVGALLVLILICFALCKCCLCCCSGKISGGYEKV